MTDHRLVLIIAGILLVACACTATKPVRSLNVPPRTPVSTSASLPTSVTLTDEHACDLVTKEVAAAVGITNPQHGRSRNKWGTVCSYDTAEVSLFVLLTDGPAQGLAELPANTDHPTYRKLGPFPAREESSDGWCALDVELVPGRTLGINLETHAHPDPVAAAETIAIHALRTLTPR